MKRGLFIAAITAMTFTGCVKTDLNDLTTQDLKQKITFDSPILYSSPTTKAGYYGEIGQHIYPGSSITYSYPREESFIIYAVKHTGDLVSWNGSGSEACLFYGDPLTYDTNTDSWAPKEGDNYYYWPEGKKLSFAAVSPAVMDQGSGFSLNYNETGLTINNFTVPAEPGSQIDVLFSERTVNKTNSNMQHGASYYSGIPLKFQHALSSIHFSVKKEGVAAKVYLTRVELRKAKNKGTFKENIDESKGVTNYVIGQTVTPSWTVDPSSKQNSYVAFEGKIEFPEEPRYISDLAANDTDETDENEKSHPLILMPQDIEDDVELVVTYAIGNAEGKTKTIQLNQYPNSGTPLTEWEFGKRYTYRLVYSSTSEQQDRIYFSPSTDGWKDVDAIVINL